MRTFVSAAVYYKQYWPCIQKASSILSHTFDQLQFTENNIVLRHRIEYVFLKCTIQKMDYTKNNRISPISDICLYISSQKCPITKVLNHRMTQKGQQIVRTSLNNRLLFNRINLSLSQIETTRNPRRRHSS